MLLEGAETDGNDEPDGRPAGAFRLTSDDIRDVAEALAAVGG